MQTWIDAVRAELGLREDVDLTLLLEVARVAAHAVEHMCRKAAEAQSLAA